MDDQSITIATAPNRMSKTWKNVETTWEKFLERAGHVSTTGETMAEYRAMPKAERDSRKDIGGFVGGFVRDGRRKKGNVRYRDLLTLDLDMSPTYEVLEGILKGLGCRCIAYPTHSSSEAKPRYRVIILLSRHVTSEEYEPLARRVALKIGIDYMDSTTYEPERLMYWPSVPSDADTRVIHLESEGTALDADAILGEYEDWRDASSWPVGQTETVAHTRALKKLGDPCEKPGVIGCFCRAYGVKEAIERFIPEIYTPVIGNEDRYTYAKGSTTGGAIVYEDKYLYSHHDTDPAGGGYEVNAFDLVRIHKFGALDEGIDEKTPMAKRPSFSKMVDMAWRDGAVRSLALEGDAALMTDDLLAQGWDSKDINKLDKSWMANLDINKNSPDPKGLYRSTMHNFVQILRHDARVTGMVGHDIFSDRLTIRRRLPWGDEDKIGSVWTDADDSRLRIWFDETYHIHSKDAIGDGIAEMAETFRFHPVRDYLDALEWDGIPRAERILIEFLGAEDSPYTEEMTLIWEKEAVARVLHPGCKADMILVLVGPQGIGKSTILAKLGGKWFNDTLNSVHGKDAMVQLQGSWIVEMGEAQAVSKAENDELKAYITRQVDRFRAPYGRRVHEYPRQCVFAATTNDDIFLKDRTGGRRFGIIRCRGIADEEKRKKMLAKLTPEYIAQVWAEAKERYLVNPSLLLSDGVLDEARRLQEESTEGAEKMGLIQNFLNLPRPKDWKNMTLRDRRDFSRQEGRYDAESGIRVDESECEMPRQVCAMEILCELFEMDKKNIRNLDIREINTIMQHMPGWKKHDSKTRMLRFPLYGRQRAYDRESIPVKQKKG